MLTLGYICEDLRPEDMDQDTKNKIVQTLVMNVHPEHDKIEITKLAIKAF